MSEKKIDSMEEWLPRKVEVFVGKSEKTIKRLIVEEMVAAKRDAVVKTLLLDLDASSILRPIVEAVRSGGENVAKVDLAEMAIPLKKVALDLLSNHMTKISCIVLDTKENRNRVGDDVPPDTTSADNKFGYKYSEPMFDWIGDNLTVRQEQQVFEAMVNVNDFAGLVKNYSTLVGAMLSSAARADKASR